MCRSSHGPQMIFSHIMYLAYSQKNGEKGNKSHEVVTPTILGLRKEAAEISETLPGPRVD
jgi:hypothetical protein